MSGWRFSAEVWQWQARTDGWFFVTVPAIQSAAIAELPREPRGFGSVRVRATIGGTTWGTSVFPDSRRGGYALPLKKGVRDAEGLGVGDRIEVRLELA